MRNEQRYYAAPHYAINQTITLLLLRTIMNAVGNVW